MKSTHLTFLSILTAFLLLSTAIMAQDTDALLKKANEHFVKGRTYYLDRRYDFAVEELRRYKDIMKTLNVMDENLKKLYIKDLFYLSEVYFTLKRYPEAREELNEILKLNPKEPGAYYNLGVYYYVYEHSRSVAYSNFKKAIDLDPSSEGAKSARYAIEFMRSNPDSRFAPDFSFIDKE